MLKNNNFYYALDSAKSFPFITSAFNSFRQLIGRIQLVNRVSVTVRGAQHFQRVITAHYYIFLLQNILPLTTLLQLQIRPFCDVRILLAQYKTLLNLVLYLTDEFFVQCWLSLYLVVIFEEFAFLLFEHHVPLLQILLKWDPLLVHGGIHAARLVGKTGFWASKEAFRGVKWSIDSGGFIGSRLSTIIFFLILVEVNIGRQHENILTHHTTVSLARQVVHRISFNHLGIFRRSRIRLGNRKIVIA